jgi:hypothetical protein
VCCSRLTSESSKETIAELDRGATTGPCEEPHDPIKTADVAVTTTCLIKEIAAPWCQFHYATSPRVEPPVWRKGKPESNGIMARRGREGDLNQLHLLASPKLLPVCAWPISPAAQPQFSFVLPRSWSASYLKSRPWQSRHRACVVLYSSSRASL